MVNISYRDRNLFKSYGNILKEMIFRILLTDALFYVMRN